jgi:dUTP pyrophosphatase
MLIRIKLLSPHAIEPRRKAGDAGSDLYATHDVDVNPGCVAHVDFGLAVELPSGCCAYVVPRSGLASQGKLAITGLVDPEYRGSVGATLLNTTREAWRVKRGDRVAQLVVHSFDPAQWDVTAEDLAVTDRGSNGFGSSGIR